MIETAGSYEPPEEVTFTVGDTTASLTVLTEDDEQQEGDGAVIATLQPGTDYRLGQASTQTAQVAVEDDEGGAPPGPIGPGLPPVPNPVPSAPRNLEAVGGDEQVTLFWEVPEDDGGFPITDYEYLISGTGGGWISTGSTETTHTVAELTRPGLPFPGACGQRGRRRQLFQPGRGDSGSGKVGVCPFRQRFVHHLRSGVGERVRSSHPSLALLLRPGRRKDCSRIGSGGHRRAGGHRGRKLDCSD